MSELLAVFVIATLGYLIGRITICGIDLGTAAVLLVAKDKQEELGFGHKTFARIAGIAVCMIFSKRTGSSIDNVLPGRATNKSLARTLNHG